MISTNTMSGLLLTAVLQCGVVQAAEPEFRPGLVTESYTYERQSSSFSIAGVPAGGTMVSVSRVTVAVDGMLITGQWEPKPPQSASAKDFSNGGDVLAAVTRRNLLLKLPDDSVVTAKIVKREKQQHEP